MSTRTGGTGPTRPAIDHTRDWPLIGRDAELAVGRRLLERPGTSLVIGGAAGVGKSRLGLELAELVAAELDGRVLRVIASPALTEVPGAAIAPLVSAAPAPSTEPLGDIGAPAHAEDIGVLLPRLHESIGAVAASYPVIVVVDDAHLLDEVSAAALRQLVVTGGVRLVASVRSGEPMPTDVAALARGDGGDRLELMALSVDDVGDLLGAVLGAPPAPDAARLLAERSDGNCLALRELILDSLASDRFTTVHGVVRWEPSGGIGHRLIDLVDSWLGTLDRDEAATLLAVALGAPVPARVRLSADSVDRLAYDRLEDRGAIVVEDDGTVRLGHPLYGEAARVRASSLETAAARRMLITGFLDALRPEIEAFSPERPGALLGDLGTATDLLRVGRWLLEDAAGPRAETGTVDDDEHRVVLAAAAELAARLGEIETAAAIAEAAVAMGSVTSLAVLAEALVRLGRTDEAADAVERLWGEVTQPTAGVVRRAVQTELTINLLHRHDTAAGQSAVDAALGRVDDPEDVAFIRAAHASFLAMIGELADADEQLHDLDAGSPEVRLRAVPGRVAVLVAAGRIDEAVALSDAAVAEAFAVQAEAPEGLRWSVSALANALLTGGELERLAQLIELGRSFETADSEAAAFRGLIEGRALLFAGRGHDARATLSDAAAWYGARGQRMRVRWLLALLAEATLLAGDHAAARAIAGEAMAADRAHNLADHDADRALAWVQACTDGSAPSAAGSLAVADAARDAGARPFELLALWDALRLTSSKEARRRIVGLAPSITSPLATLIGAAAGARTAGELDDVAQDFAGAGFTQWAAETARRAARARRDDGRRSAAARADAQASTWWEACGRPWSPMLAAAASATVGELTAREAEVAGLAAGGATSRAIAEQLGISVRTVDNLLGKVYLKLGIGGRDALAETLDGAQHR